MQEARRVNPRSYRAVRSKRVSPYLELSCITSCDVFLVCFGYSARFALAAPQAQLQFSTNVSKSSQRHATRRANELLNFTFAKRERTGEQNAAQPNSRSRRAALKRNVSSYSKEQYLLANCQFAVRHGAPLKGKLDFEANNVFVCAVLTYTGDSRLGFAC